MSENVNQIYYHDKPLLLGPRNFFKLCFGPNPSFGFFRMRQDDVDFVLDDESGVAGELKFVDSHGNEVTLHYVYLVKAETLEENRYLAAASDLTDKQCMDIVLSDERITWQHLLGTQDYNTYVQDKSTTRDVSWTPPAEAEESCTDYLLTNLNPTTSNEWTYEEIFKDIFENVLGLADTDYALEFDDEEWLRKPRNVRAKQMPIHKVLERLLADMPGFLTYDPTKVVGEERFRIYSLDSWVEADMDQLEEISSLAVGGKTIRLNPAVNRGEKAYMRVNLASGTKHSVVGTGIVAGGGPGSSVIPSPYSQYGEGTNLDYLQDIADELATVYVNSFANGWRDITFDGIRGLIQNTAVHEITWRANATGAFTQVRAFRPRADYSHNDTLHVYRDYWSGGGGDASLFARIIRSLTRGDVLADPPVPSRSTYRILLLGTEQFTVWAVGTEYVGTPEEPGDKVRYSWTESTWDEEAQEYVSEEREEYFQCIRTHVATSGNAPDAGETFWMEIEIGEEAWVLGYEGDLLESAPWYHVDDIVKVAQRGEYEVTGLPTTGGETRWYILGTVFQVEDSSSGERVYSLLQLVDSSGPTRVAAVFG